MQHTEHCKDCYDDIGHDTALGCYKRNCPCHKVQHTEESWAESWKKAAIRHLQLIEGEETDGLWVDEKEVKEFISYLLLSQKKELREKVEALRNSNPKGTVEQVNGFQAACNEVLSILT